MATNESNGALSASGPTDVIQWLHSVIEEQPEMTSLDLSDHEIDDQLLTQMVDVIAQLPNLEELNLADNLFTVLPTDLSSWEQVTKIQLSNVNFEDFETAVHALSTMPSLKSLFINLHEEPQVDLIMHML